MSSDWPPLSSLSTGLAVRCPRCGRGRLFDGLLKIHPACGECGLDLRGHDAGDGPAVSVILGLGAVMMGLVLWVEFRFGPPVWVHLALWTPVVIALTILPLRLIKGVLVAQQYRHRSTAGEDGPT
jgi:uncharacterized protein (DUF983 family)